MAGVVVSVVVSPENASKLDQAIAALIGRLSSVAPYGADSEESYRYARALESAVNARINISSY
jgi:hypothetical protein